MERRISKDGPKHVENDDIIDTSIDKIKLLLFLLRKISKTTKIT